MSFIDLNDLSDAISDPLSSGGAGFKANGGRVELLEAGNCAFRPDPNVRNVLAKLLGGRAPEVVVTKLVCMRSTPIMAVLGGFYHAGHHCAPRLQPAWSAAWHAAGRLEHAALERAKHGAAALNQRLGVGTPKQPVWWRFTQAKTSDVYVGGPPGDPYPIIVLGVDVGRLPGGFEGIFRLPNLAPNGVLVSFAEADEADDSSTV